jgi:hypothetical protein
MKRLLFACLFLLSGFSLFGQTVASQGVSSFYGVSAANAQQQIVFDLKNGHDTLAINGACSAGTAALTVDAGVDGIIFFTIDSVAAAATQIKQYSAATVGATIAVSPLSFRYVRVTVATCGGGNTSTLTISAK